MFKIINNIMMFPMKVKQRILMLILIFFAVELGLVHAQKKGFSIEVYPSEIDEDNSIVAGDDLYRANLRGLWNNVNPYYGYVNNPYILPPYMPMYGYAQPPMTGNYYMSMNGQRSAYNTPNPLNFNYPKTMHLKGNQYNLYPKFKEKPTTNENTENGENSKETSVLTKELENQIKELQRLTKEAKELARKKANLENKNGIAHANLNSNSNSTLGISSQQFNNSTLYDISQEKKKLLKKSKIEQLKLNPQEKQKFDSEMKSIIDKLNHLN